MQCLLVRGDYRNSSYELLDHLFDNYRKDVRPSINGEPTNVNLSMSIVSIISFDEKNQIIEVFANLRFQWTDVFLTWDPAQYGNIDSIVYPQKELWLPDTYVANDVNSLHQFGYDELQCTITDKGLVTWQPKEIFTLFCTLDITYYPFDTQNCNIVLATVTSTVDKVLIAVETSNLDNTLYGEGGTWVLENFSISFYSIFSGFSTIIYNMELRRLRTYYVMNIILPVVFLSLTASAVFYLPADAGEKMGMSLTVLLAYAVYLTIIADKIPQTSLQVSLLGVYMNILLGVTAMGVMISVVVLHLHHKPSDIPIGRKTSFLIRKVRLFLGLHRSIKKRNTRRVSPMEINDADCTNVDENGSKNLPPGMIDNFVNPDSKKRQMSAASVTSLLDVEEEELTWPKVAETLDRVMFWFFSVFICVVTLVMIPLISIRGEGSGK